jgi:hypothetical protein
MEKDINQQEARELLIKALQKRAATQIVIWALVTSAGVIITLFSYMNADAGETYVVFWGAIIFGAIALVRAIVAFKNAPQAVDDAIAEQSVSKTA